MPIRSRDGRSDLDVALPTVAIVGRPNVGKSTLFNRILRRREAIVAKRPGVTRDRLFAPGDWAGHAFTLIDTGGIVEVTDRPMDAEIRGQVEAAITHADAIIMVVDGQAGIHPIDEHVAGQLRRSGKPVVLAVNKIDDQSHIAESAAFFRLGLGEPVPVAALSGRASGDLLDRVVELLAQHPADSVGPPVDLRVAIIGKPNVGKSSFTNRLLGEARVIVDEVAGTTRDAIDTYLEIEDERICLIDTAGLRRKSNVDDEVEFYSRLRAQAAIRRADVCLLLVDNRAGVTNQDFHVGEEAWREGCGLVLVANKWDLIEDRGPDVLARFERDLRERAAYLRWVPIITTSALSGQRVHKALEVARSVHRERTRRIPTAEVNRTLAALIARTQPPQTRRGEVRIFYGSQVATEPPLFALWCNRPRDVPRNYLRYLSSGFRRQWGFEGVPLKLKLRARGEEEE